MLRRHTNVGGSQVSRAYGTTAGKSSAITHITMAMAEVHIAILR